VDCIISYKNERQLALLQANSTRPTAALKVRPLT
jgi:hypothetical protein